MPVAVPAARHSTPPTVAVSQAFSGQRRGAGDLGAARADQREDRPLGAEVGDLDLAPDRVHRQVAQDRLQRLGLGVEQDLLRRRPQHPHVRLHVALAVEQRRVLALAGRQRLDVVGQLPLQVLGGVGPADQQLAAVGAIEQPAFLTQLPVLGIQLHGARVVTIDPRNRRLGDGDGLREPPHPVAHGRASHRPLRIFRCVKLSI